MKVYVVTFTESYDGPIFEAVFGTLAAAEQWVLQEEGAFVHRSISEHEIDVQ